MEIFWERSDNKLCARVLNFDVPHRMHWHKNVEICQVINKPCDFLVDGSLITAQPGDIIVINEYTIHRFLVKNKNTDIRVIQFPIKTVLNVNTELQPLKKHITADEIANISGLGSKIEKLFEMMQEEQQLVVLAKDNLFFQSLLMSFYFLLMKHFADRSGERKGKEQNEFYSITEHINNHYKENITVKSLAECLFIPRGRLSQIFKKYSGESVNDYINSIRIKTANELLISGATVTKAAFESGFQSVRTFNNIYKEEMGITPKEYLQSRREDKNGA